MKRRPIFLLIAIAVALAIPVTAQTSPATFTTITDFGEGDGQYPSPLAQGLDGNLYGTVVYAHRTDTGADSFFFDLTTSGMYTNLPGYSCTTYSCSGSKSDSGVTLAGDGNFYGTTSYGGDGQYRNVDQAGTLFRGNPQTGLTTLYSFCSKLACQDGKNPYTPLTLGSDGNLYGLTQAGGLHRYGTAYILTLGGEFNTLHNFCALPNCVDGAGPNSLIQANDGNFYGVATGGTGVDCAEAAACGIVFRMTPQGAVSTVYNFCSESNCVDGSFPRDIIQAADGNLYGITQSGGSYATNNYSGSGTIFKLTLGGKLTTLYSFCALAGCQYGIDAGELLQANDGNFYGVVFLGEGALCYDGYGCGTIFEITPSGAFTTLYTFCEELGQFCPDGSLPDGLFQATDGNFYGTTFRGGPSGYGTAFQLSTGLAPFVETVTSYGAVGASVIILGNNLTGATGVTFNGTPAKYIVVSDTEITAAVPVGATAGPVEVTAAGTILKSNRKFNVTN